MDSKSKLIKTGYELESVHIVQAPVSNIEHRAECDPMIEMCGRKVYPVIVSPMGAVTNEHNYKIWLDHNFMCVVPRTVDYAKRIEISTETFASFSLSEAEGLAKDINDGLMHYICVDIAHGTMEKLYNVCRSLRESLGNNIVIMTGNVANPEAYQYYVNSGIDYMRACIGTGSRCVVEGSKIRMADGSEENIENIDVGDVVQTIDGNKKVINTFSKTAKKTIIINGKLEVTPNHKVLVVKKADAVVCTTDEEIKKHAFYIEAQYLTPEYLLVEG